MGKPDVMSMIGGGMFKKVKPNQAIQTKPNKLSQIFQTLVSLNNLISRPTSHFTASKSDLVRKPPYYAKTKPTVQSNQTVSNTSDDLLC